MARFGKMRKFEDLLFWVEYKLNKLEDCLHLFYIYIINVNTRTQGVLEYKRGTLELQGVSEYTRGALKLQGVS